MSASPPSPAARVMGRPRKFDRAAALERALEVFWRKGFAPTSIAELCAAMGINPPSLYGAFGNKAQLFLEAVDHYEKTYWDAAWETMNRDPDVTRAIITFFSSAAAILTTPQAPCGCMVALGVINVPPEAKEVVDALKALREEGSTLFVKRLQQGVSDRQLAADFDVETVGMTLNTLLQGMSLKAADGASHASLLSVATCVGVLVGISERA